MAKVLKIRADALVVLVGPAGAGKSTFARTHFRPAEILSSDFFRAMVSDDEADQEASVDAFRLLTLALEMRLARGKLCVVDATNVRPEHRAGLLAAACVRGRPSVAVVFDTPENLAVKRAVNRAQRVVPAAVVRRQIAELQATASLMVEGFAAVYRISPDDAVQVVREPLL